MTARATKNENLDIGRNQPAAAEKRGRGQPAKWRDPVTRSVRIERATWDLADAYAREHGLTLPECMEAAIRRLCLAD